MNPAALRIACAAVFVVLGIGAGAWLQSSRTHLRSHPGVRVPAGVASAPNPSDLTPEPGAVVPPVAGSAAAPPADGDLPLEGALPARKIPERLPQFSLTDRAGKATPIAAFAGKSLVINFWATWCAPCRREIPLLESLNAEWAERGVSVVGIAVDYRDKVLEFADRFKIDYALLIGEQEALDAAAAFGVGSPVFPFTVFTDRRNEVVAVYIGELHRPQAVLILNVVHDLDGGRLVLPAARKAIAEGLSALPDHDKDAPGRPNT
jgi:thiol-disulfide isomerase/thioredoxin